VPGQSLGDGRVDAADGQIADEGVPQAVEVGEQPASPPGGAGRAVCGCLWVVLAAR